MKLENQSLSVNKKGFASIYVLIILHVLLIFFTLFIFQVTSFYILKKEDISFHLAELEMIKKLKNDVKEEDIVLEAMESNGYQISFIVDETSILCTLQSKKITKSILIEFHEEQHNITKYTYLNKNEP